MKHSLRIPDYLEHIIDAAGRIQQYTADMDEASFLATPLVQDAVIRNIEIMGEASRNLEKHAPDFTAQHPGIPWTEVYLMRNRLSHGYFSVDLSLIWKTIQRDIPELANAVRAVISHLPGKEQPPLTAPPA